MLSAAALLQPVAAQTAATTSASGQSRSELAERLRVADSLGLRDEAFVLRSRLTNGDFEVGDRIDVTYEGTVLKRADSLVVMAGKIIRLGEPMGDLRIQGLLRYEADDSIRARVSKYYRATVVHVTPRLRLLVTGGGVRNSGSFYAKSDMTLSEVIMRAGGQDPTTDLANVVIKRGTQTIWAKQDVQSALTDGMTVEGLHLEAGDEVVVGVRTPGRGLLWLQIGLSMIAITSGILLGRR